MEVAGAHVRVLRASGQAVGRVLPNGFEQVVAKLAPNRNHVDERLVGEAPQHPKDLLLCNRLTGTNCLGCFQSEGSAKYRKPSQKTLFRSREEVGSPVD